MTFLISKYDGVNQYPQYLDHLLYALSYQLCEERITIFLLLIIKIGLKSSYNLSMIILLVSD